MNDRSVKVSSPLKKTDLKEIYPYYPKRNRSKFKSEHVLPKIRENSDQGNSAKNKSIYFATAFIKNSIIGVELSPDQSRI